MLVKSQVKYIQSLGHKKFRDADGVFVAEGPKIVGEMMQAENLSLQQCIATDSWIASHQILLKGKEGILTEAAASDLDKISFLKTPNDVIAVFTKPTFTHKEKEQEVVLLLDRIQDPGNLGTIIRTADWFGVDKIICSEDTADVFNPKIVQAAMGSLLRVETIYQDLVRYIHQHADMTLLAASLDGEDLLEKITNPRILLLMGNESSGIGQELQSLAQKKIRIPKKGGAESLNVAVASGILLSMIH